MPGINTKGNTKKILSIQVKELPLFPVLAQGGNGRIFTKHFTNLVPCLTKDEISLLSFLIYQSELDNSIIYSTKLLKQYDTWVHFCQGRYGKRPLSSSVPKTRLIFKDLIEKGFLLLTTQLKCFLVNPNLTYSKEYVKIKFYNSWTMLYRYGSHGILELTTLFRNHIK